MAGRAYRLTRPGDDPQPKKFSNEPVGYAEGFTPRPRYARSNATAMWAQSSAPVTSALHCNIRPRISLAGTLDVQAARALGVGPWIPGRRPAPRVEMSCIEAADELRDPSGAFARDLVLRKPQASPRNPDGGPPAGPGPNPPGLDPLPPGGPPVPRDPPVVPAPPGPPAIPPVGPAPPVPPAAPISPRVPGTLQAVNFHLTGDIAGGSATSELRVYGPVGVPFILRRLWINGDSGVAPGQFLDVLVSADGDTTDTATPSGESIFPLLSGLGALPAVDAPRGIAIPAQLLDLDMSYRVDTGNRWLKVMQSFQAPALGLANIHVTLIVERMDAPGMFPPPLVPRPPIIPPALPPLVPAPPGAPVGTGWVIPQVLSTGQGNPLLPAWRVAAQGLQPRRLLAGSLGSYRALDAYVAWHLDPTSAAASAFAARITQVLENAGISGSGHTLVPLSAAIPAGQ